MWFKPMSFMKVLFFLNRYIPLAAGFVNASVFLNASPTLSASLCGHWFKFQSGEALAVLGIIQAILVVRIWAIYNRNRFVLIILGVFGCLQLAASGTITGISTTQGVASSQPGPGFFTCSITTPSYFAAYWIPILTFEITLFLLTLIKGLEHFRRANQLGKLSGLSKNSGHALLTILVRGSVMYFFIIAAVYAGNAAVWYWADSSLYQASSVFGLMIPPMVATKLLLSLRSSFYNDQDTTVNLNSTFELAVFRARSTVETRPGQTHNLGRSQQQWEEWGGGANIVSRSELPTH